MITILNATQNNLKSISLNLPDNRIIVVTGIEGSGTSSLVYDIIFNEAQRRYFGTFQWEQNQLNDIVLYADVEYIAGLSPAVNLNRENSDLSLNVTVGELTGISELLQLFFIRFGKRITGDFNFSVAGYSLNDFQNYSINRLSDILLTNSAFKEEKANIIIGKIVEKCQWLLQLGLGNISIHKKITTLNGGEIQQLRLVNAVTSRLRGILYIIDEPAKGLHSKYFQIIMELFWKLRLVGNTVILVENNRHIVKSADWIVDIGPGAGSKGGLLLFNGTVNNFLKEKNSGNSIIHNSLSKSVDSNLSQTGKVVQSSLIVLCNSEIPKIINNSPIEITGIKTHNLKNISVKIPNNKLTVVTGVSGSGKSSLIFDTLYKAGIKRYVGSILQRLNKNLINSKADKFDDISGLMPTVSINRKSACFNELSTIGKVSGIDDKLGLLFSKIGKHKDGSLPMSESYFSFTHKNGVCKNCNGLGYINQKNICCECNGNRLNKRALQYLVKNLNMSEMSKLAVLDFLRLLRKWVVFPDEICDNPLEKKAVQILMGHIINGLDILNQLGLGYLSLNRTIESLSGGEGQRVHLASCISLELKGICLVLDEPTLGLHSHDIENLYFMIKELLVQGNTVVVSENDSDFIRKADYIIELGIGAGKNGGEVIASGSVNDILNSHKSVIKKYLDSPEYGFRTKKSIDCKKFEIKGARANNLKSIDISIPLSGLVSISGVSGSGKTSLLQNVIYESFNAQKPINCVGISGFENIDNVEYLSQKPEKMLSSESVSSYIGISTVILKPISAITTISTSLVFTRVVELSALLGIGYLEMGRALNSLSTGEFQRLKMLKLMVLNYNIPTLFLMDEPTVGLHFDDVKLMINTMDFLIEKGHRFIVVEHNRAVIQSSDFVIELGPGAGDKGGMLVSSQV